MTDIAIMPQPPSGDPLPENAVDNPPKVRSITGSDKGRVEAAMTLAFIADPVARWAFPDPLQYIETFRPFVTLFGGKSFDHGSAHIIGDFLGAALWLPPDVQPDDGPVGELFEQNVSQPRLGQLLSLFEQMSGFHPHQPHWHLAVLGVDAMHQRRGCGSQLMRPALARCDRDRVPAYLEASSPANRAFYERHGFRVLGEIRSGDSPPMFPMLREPR